MKHLIRASAGLIVAVGTLLGSDTAASRADEITILKTALPLAKDGDPAGMEALIALVEGDYIRSGEGGEWLNAIYLDLLLEYPEIFLSAIGRAEEGIREKAVAQLLTPVHDAYSGGDLLAAVRYARDRGIAAPFMPRLLAFYGDLDASGRQNIGKIRADLELAFKRCEHWGGEEPYDAARRAQIMAGHERDCAAALQLARETYWTSPEDPVVAATVVDLIGYLGPASDPRAPWSRVDRKEQICRRAAFFYRALAKYTPRSRGYFNEVCRY